jgi:hypothetical protein
MWKIKKFKTRQELDAWLDKNKYKVQFVEVFMNNAYGGEYRPLRHVY